MSFFTSFLSQGAANSPVSDASRFDLFGKTILSILKKMGLNSTDEDLALIANFMAIMLWEKYKNKENIDEKSLTDDLKAQLNTLKVQDQEKEKKIKDLNDKFERVIQERR